jgi:hypothetical protein
MSERGRITVHYSGAEFIIADRDLDDVVSEIERGLASPDPTWLDAFLGEGRSTPARLLLMPGIPIGVSSVNANGSPSPSEPLKPAKT